MTCEIISFGKAAKHDILELFKWGFRAAKLITELVVNEGDRCQLPTDPLDKDCRLQPISDLPHGDRDRGRVEIEPAKALGKHLLDRLGIEQVILKFAAFKDMDGT